MTDKQVRELMLDDAINNSHLEKDKAALFVTKYSDMIIEDIWSVYEISYATYLADFLKDNNGKN